MVQFRPQAHEVIGKVVYYGPPLGGKTTNLRTLYSGYPSDSHGELVVVPTGGDRTIFFDFLPIFAGKLRGMDLRVQLYTVPGQVHYNATRQVVLRGVDGVVFVADSQRELQRSNLESWENLKENLLLQGLELADIPHVIQYNKRDLPDILPVEELDSLVNEYNAPFFESVATVGIGVEETLQAAVKLVVRSLRERFHMPLEAPLTQPVVVPPQRSAPWVRGRDGSEPGSTALAELAGVTQRIVVPSPMATPGDGPSTASVRGGDVFGEAAGTAPQLVEIDVLGEPPAPSGDQPVPAEAPAAAPQARFDTLPGTATAAPADPFGVVPEAPRSAAGPTFVPEPAIEVEAPFGEARTGEVPEPFVTGAGADFFAEPLPSVEIVDVPLSEIPPGDDIPGEDIRAAAPELPVLPMREDAATAGFLAVDALLAAADEPLAFEAPAEQFVMVAPEAAGQFTLDAPPRPTAVAAGAAGVSDSAPFALDEAPFPELEAPAPSAADDVFAIIPAPPREPEPVERIVLGELQPRIMAALGNVRELELEIPVPAKWIGGRRMTVQLRLTLVPQQESDDD